MRVSQSDFLPTIHFRFSWMQSTAKSRDTQLYDFADICVPLLPDARDTAPNLFLTSSQPCVLVMGCDDTKLNCTAWTTPIQPDPDITGYGVLVAFVLSALMTVIAVIAAYLTDSMPSHCMTDTDQSFIEAFQKVWQKYWPYVSESSPVLFIGLCWIVITRLIFGCGPSKPRQRRTRDEREALFTGFILALSDQQLVVGLAILIAAVSNQRTLSIEEYKIAFGLAWFSSTTHLATLDNLQSHFHRHTTARNIRVGGMLILLIFFVYCFGVIWRASLDSSSRLVQCYLDGCYPGLDESVSGLSPLGALANTSWLVTLLLILVEYQSRILQSYTLPSNGSYGVSLPYLYVYLRFVKFFRRRLYSQSLRDASMHEWSYILNEANRARWADRLATLLFQFPGHNQTAGQGKTALILPAPLPDPLVHAPVRFLTQWSIGRLSFNISSHIYRRSSLSQAPSLAFMLSYGFVQLVYYRWVEPDFEDTRDMGFGQITPLFLLLLPGLVATEMYYGSVSPGSKPLQIPPQPTLPASEPFPFDDIRMPHYNQVKITDEQDLDEMERRSRKYDDNPDMIKRYFYSRSQHIEFLQYRAVTDADRTAIQESKARFWVMTEYLHTLEDDLGLKRMVRAHLAIRMSGAVLVGIFVNLPSDALNLVGAFLVIMMGYFSLISVMAGWVNVDLQVYEQLLQVYRSKGGSAAGD